MKNHDLRQSIRLLAASAAAALMLTGCTQAPSGTSGPAASSSAGAGLENAGTSSAGASASSGAGTSSQAEAAASADPAPASVYDADVEEGSGSDAGLDADAGTGAGSGSDAGTGADAGFDADPEDAYQIPDDSGDPDSDSGSLTMEPLSGTYEKEDGSESVTLKLESDNVLTFAFSVSGISGTADAASMSAVYSGDDGYTITFSVEGDTLTVTVGGEDAGDSPLNGTYQRLL